MSNLFNHLEALHEDHHEDPHFLAKARLYSTAYEKGKGFVRTEFLGSTHHAGVTRAWFNVTRIDGSMAVLSDRELVHFVL